MSRRRKSPERWATTWPTRSPSPASRNRNVITPNSSFTFASWSLQRGFVTVDLFTGINAGVFSHHSRARTGTVALGHFEADFFLVQGRHASRRRRAV